MDNAGLISRLVGLPFFARVSDILDKKTFIDPFADTVFDHETVEKLDEFLDDVEKAFFTAVFTIMETKAKLGAKVRFSNVMDVKTISQLAQLEQIRDKEAKLEKELYADKYFFDELLGERLPPLPEDRVYSIVNGFRLIIIPRRPMFCNKCVFCWESLDKQLFLAIKSRMEAESPVEEGMSEAIRQFMEGFGGSGLPYQ